MNLVEDYCSYELAKLLKEKGFDEPVETVIYPNGEWAFIDTRSVSRTLHTMLRNSELNIYDDCVSMPTHQLACKWLREKYNLFFSVGFGNDDKGDFLYMVDIYDLTNDSINGRYKPIIEADDYLKYNPKTYEEATEAALKYALENLI